MGARTRQGFRRLASLCWLVTAFLVLWFGTTARAAEPTPELHELLTDEEIGWLSDRDSVRLAYDGHFPPYSFRDDAGDIQGFSVDVFALLAERTGLRFDVHERDTWDELYADAQSRRVDVVATMVERPERHAWFRFTTPYVFKSLVVMTRTDDHSIQVKQNLADKTVALVKSYQYTDRVLAEFPTIQPLYVETMADGLNAVSTHKADAAITFFGGGHYLRSRHMMTNLKFAAVYDRDTSSERIAVRDDWPQLVSILDKALSTITADERLELEERWLPSHQQFDDPARMKLTEAEQRWVREHPVIRLGVDPEFHPFEFIDEQGVHRGITADMVALLNERTGLNMVIVPDLTWQQAVDGARNGTVDVLPAVGFTDERKQFLRYTEPYVRFHRVIITRSDAPFLQGEEDLRGLRVAVQANSSHAGYLADKTDIEPREYDTLQEAILSVAEGETDALVGNLASTSYWIRKLTVTNLKVAGATAGEAPGLHLGVRKDWPELAGILQKGLASITPAERQEISRRWVVLQFEPETDYGPILRVVTLAAAMLAITLIWILVARRQAQRLGQARDLEEAARARAEGALEDLQRLQENLETLVQERTEELQASEQRFRRAQRMEALGTLVGGIAHDFNNILNSLLAAVELARMRAELGQPIADELDTSEMLCMRGADLISQLLAFARQDRTNKEVLAIDELVRETSRLLVTAVPSNVHVDVQSAPDTVWVRGSAALLQQAILNLVINARDALEGRQDPRITVTIGPVPDDVTALDATLHRDRTVLLTVQDNGPGIAANHVDRVFDPFFTTKAPGKGTGLGLAMVYGTVVDHGGTIDLETTAESGTRFRIFLPTVEAPAEPPAPLSTHRPVAGDHHILIAEDDVTMREIYHELLTDAGYRVTDVGDGQDAVDAVVQAPDGFALVVLDSVMPRLGGLATARRIRELAPSTRIVLLSGYGPNGIPQDGPFDVVLFKPIGIADLMSVLAEQIELYRSTTR